jgi:hypothetical protein
MALGSRSDVAKDPEARIAQLEAMRQHNSLLFEARHADEYKALIEARNSGPNEVRRLDANASRQKIAAMDGGQELLQEWGEATPAKVATVQQSVGEMLRDMGDQHAQGGFMFGVSQLPGKTQTALARELSSPSPSNITPASADEISEYKAYGITDPMQVAKVEARAKRALQSDADGSLLQWWRGLPANQQAAVVKQLARG